MTYSSFKEQVYQITKELIRPKCIFKVQGFVVELYKDSLHLYSTTNNLTRRCKPKLNNSFINTKEIGFISKPTTIKSSSSRSNSNSIINTNINSVFNLLLRNDKVLNSDHEIIFYSDSYSNDDVLAHFKLINKTWNNDNHNESKQEIQNHNITIIIINTTEVRLPSQKQLYNHSHRSQTTCGEVEKKKIKNFKLSSLIHPQ
ncbi:hypothetical protein ACTA71_010685 [Dictyostelium dimigraforme]